MPVGVPRNGRPERRTALPSPLSAAAPLGLARRTPRLLATASASLVRREIASRSCSATRAMMPTVRSFASGRSAASNPHAAVPERQQEGSVARQPVQLRDEQRRPCDLGKVQRLAPYAETLARTGMSRQTAHRYQALAAGRLLR